MVENQELLKLIAAMCKAACFCRTGGSSSSDRSGPKFRRIVEMLLLPFWFLKFKNVWEKIIF